MPEIGQQENLLRRDLSTEDTQPIRVRQKETGINQAIGSAVELYNDPETQEKLKKAKEELERRIAKATNGFLDVTEKLREIVPNKYLASGMLAVLETFGIGGYGVADALTILSGLRDIAAGRELTNDPRYKSDLLGAEVTPRNKAYLRGGLKIIGALTPLFPTFWVEPVLREVMPIPELDNKITK